MSLILDALNRSRQDGEQMPGLASDHLARPAEAGANWVQWALVCALALAVLAIGWLLLAGLPQPTVAVQPAPQIAQSVVEMAAPEPPARREPVPTVPVAPEPVAAAPVATGPTPPQGTRVESIPVPVDPGIAALYEGRVQGAAAQLPVEPAAATPATVDRPVTSSRDEEEIDIEKLVESAQAGLADDQLSSHEVPLLSALSQQTKDTVPTLMYLRHDYSGDPARSNVVLNGKTLQVGGAVGGVKVLEILPDSVVLEFKGSRFRLRALNSWVNL